MDESKRKEIKSQYEAAGIKLIVSAFGETDKPTSSGADPQQVAETMADWVIKMGLDGIDVDYEDLDAMNKQDGKAEEWLSTFTKTLREKLPQGQFILTHARKSFLFESWEASLTTTVALALGPWFNAGNYKSGAYTTVHKNVGDMIDWASFHVFSVLPCLLTGTDPPV